MKKDIAIFTPMANEEKNAEKFILEVLSYKKFFKKFKFFVYSLAFVLSFINRVIGELYFLEIASIKGKKITISPIPIRFCITSIFICFYNLY